MHIRTSSDEVVDDDDVLSVPDGSLLDLECVLSENIRSDTRRELANGQCHILSHTKLVCMNREVFPFSSLVQRQRPTAGR